MGPLLRKLWIEDRGSVTLLMIIALFAFAFQMQIGRMVLSVQEAKGISDSLDHISFFVPYSEKEHEAKIAEQEGVAFVTPIYLGMVNFRYDKDIGAGYLVAIDPAGPLAKLDLFNGCPHLNSAVIDRSQIDASTSFLHLESGNTLHIGNTMLTVCKVIEKSKIAPELPIIYTYLSPDLGFKPLWLAVGIKENYTEAEVREKIVDVIDKKTIIWPRKFALEVLKNAFFPFQPALSERGYIGVAIVVIDLILGLFVIALWAKRMLLSLRALALLGMNWKELLAKHIRWLLTYLAALFLLFGFIFVWMYPIALLVALGSYLFFALCAIIVTVFVFCTSSEVKALCKEEEK